MPNIEIHGVSSGTPGWKALELRERIFALFMGKPYAGDMVVTIFPSKVTDQKGKEQPFLRLTSTPLDSLGEITETLKSLKMDIELLELKEFISKAGT